jgi:hypothetical protein
MRTSFKLYIPRKIIDTITDYKYGIFNRHWWRMFYYEQISTRFNHRQSWLIKKIPRTWVDKDTIFETCILEGIKHFIEGEEALGKNMCHYESSQNDPDFPEWQKKFNKEVKENYLLITDELSRLNKELEDAWEKVPSIDIGKLTEVIKTDYTEKYGEVNRLEKEIEDLKTKVMLWAVSNRKSMWT